MMEETRSRHIPLPCSQPTTTSQTPSVGGISCNGTDDMMDDDGGTFPNMVAQSKDDTPVSAITTKPDSEKDLRWHPGYYLRKMMTSGKLASSSSSVEESSQVQVVVVAEEDCNKDKKISNKKTTMETAVGDVDGNNTSHGSSTSSTSSSSASSLSSSLEESPVQTVEAINEGDDKDMIPKESRETTGGDATTDTSSTTTKSQRQKQIEEALQTQLEKLQQMKQTTLSKFHEDDKYTLVFERSDSIISSSSSSEEEDSSTSSSEEDSDYYSGSEYDNDDARGGEDISASSSTVSSLSLVSYSLSDDDDDEKNQDDNAGGEEAEGEMFLEDSQKKNYHVIFQKNTQNITKQNKKSSSSMPICRTDRDHPTTSSTLLQSSSFLSVVKQAFAVGVATRNYDKNASKRQRVLLAKLVSQDLCNRPATLTTTEVVTPPPPQQSSSPPSSRLSPNILLEKVSSQQPSSPGGGTASTASSSSSSTGSDGSTGRGEGTSSTVYDVTNNHTLLPQRVTQDSLLTKHTLLALQGKTNMSRNKASGDLQEPKKTIKQNVQQSVKDQLEIPDLFVPDQTKCQSLKPTTSTSKQNHHEKQLKNIRLPSRSSRNDVAIDAFYVRPV